MSNNSDRWEALQVPLRYPTATIYVDESGVATKGRLFVVGALKVRRHGELSRALRATRDRTGFEGEYHWSSISHGKLPAYLDLVDTIAASDAHFAASVIDREIFDPTRQWPALWEAHAQVTAQLLRGCINQHELVAVSMDTISTPEAVAIEDYIRWAVNRSFGSTSIVSAGCLNSKSCDQLQAVDLLTGALAWERRCAFTGHRPTASDKAKVAARVGEKFNVDLSTDGRTRRTNVLTLSGLPARQPRTANDQAQRLFT